MAEHSHCLALAFDTEGRDFVRGVEIGRLWEQLKVDGSVTEAVHASNAEMLLRMAETTGRMIRCDVLDDTWLVAYFDAPEDA